MRPPPTPRQGPDPGERAQDQQGLKQRHRLVQEAWPGGTWMQLRERGSAVPGPGTAKAAQPHLLCPFSALPHTPHRTFDMNLLRMAAQMAMNKRALGESGEGDEGSGAGSGGGWWHSWTGHPFVNDTVPGLEIAKIEVMPSQRFNL